MFEKKKGQKSVTLAVGMETFGRLDTRKTQRRDFCPGIGVTRTFWGLKAYCAGLPLARNFGCVEKPAWDVA